MDITNEKRRIVEHLNHKSKGLVFCGFDGFVDEIVHVVDQRISESIYTRIKTISEYSKHIADAAGVSTNIEYVTQQVKIGGNGIIFSNALATFGNEIVYVGATGDPIELIFQPMQRICKELIGIAPSAHTDAVEFLDGKLIISKLQSLGAITYEKILTKLGEKDLKGYMNDAILVAFMNWTMLPHMSDIWRHLLDEILPGTNKKGYAYFDLADPQKRNREDLKEALNLIRGFSKYRDVILGLNFSEAKQIANLYNIKSDTLLSLTHNLNNILKIHGIVIHLLKEACCVIDGKYTHVKGPYCTDPVLTTGAGDNFNAGFCEGLLRSATTVQCLLLGVATSGFYVRNGYSPTREQLQAFISQWSEGIEET